MLGRQAQKHNTKLAWSAEDNLPPIVSDRSKLRQILYNFLASAIGRGSAGGTERNSGGGEEGVAGGGRGGDGRKDLAGRAEGLGGRGCEAGRIEVLAVY